MKPYGVQIEENQDVAAIQFTGRKSCIGKFPSKSGEYKSYIRKSNNKRAIRRYWKRKARLEGKKQIQEYFTD